MREVVTRMLQSHIDRIGCIFFCQLIVFHLKLAILIRFLISTVDEGFTNNFVFIYFSGNIFEFAGLFKKQFILKGLQLLLRVLLSRR